MPASSRLTYAQVVASTQPKHLKTTAQPLTDADRNSQTARPITAHQTSAHVATSKQSKPSRTTARPVVDDQENDIEDSRSNQRTVSTLDKENGSNRSHRDRRPSQKIVANRNTQEEAARRQQLLEANRAERAKRAERKLNKANGIDRPAQSDDEERDHSSFTSQAVLTKHAIKKAALVQRQSKVAANTPAPYSPPSRGRRLSTSRSHSPDQFQVNEMSPSHSLSPQGQDMSRSPSPQQGQYTTESRTSSPRLEQEQRDSSSPHSPSPPLLGRKRSHSSSEDSLHQLVKAQKVSERDGRPKASDYDDVAKEVILTATAIYRCLVSTSNAFPTPSEEGQMIKNAWQRANEETSQEVPIALTPAIAKIIAARGSQIRSEVKSRALHYVESLYGFDSGHGKSIIRRNRKLAEELKINNAGYLYKKLDTKHGLYQHPIIQKIVNRCWFNNSRDEGIVYADLFDPLSVEAIALVLTAIECGIDAWASGSNIDIPFYSSDYKPLYLRHVKTLNAFGIATSKHDLLGKLQRSLFNFGRVHAGVPSTLTKNGPILSAAALTAAVKDYEDHDSETEEDGEDID